MFFGCLFDFIIREIGNIDVVLKYSSLKVTKKKLSKKKARFDCFNESYI